ncbi:MAG: hypothetical protein KDF60_13455 [Calditrichaeota bacterium]|nr:hypothetical protein [Calditrichota bacterium]
MTAKIKFKNKPELSRNVLMLSLVILIFLIASCSKDDQITQTVSDSVYIPDEQFEFILIEQNIDSDGAVNQEISRTDALIVTHLDLNFTAYNRQIEDLTGIEGFSNLTFLKASGHLIEEIDLRHNTQLDTVLLSANYVSDIDVSNNTKLIYLDLQSNELHSINGLSKLKNLIKLDLSWNLLDSLSFSSETIEVLLAGYNHLKFFEAKNAGNLKSIILTSNWLSSVNLSWYPLLETLLLSDNNIQTIDLGQNGNLSHLYISGNSLSGLSVSSNPNLVDLRVDRNPDLTCIHINTDQEIPSVSLSDYQELSTNCN